MSEDDTALTRFGAVTTVAAVTLVAAVAVLGIGGALQAAGDASPAPSELITHTTTDVNESGAETDLHTLPAETENQTDLHTLPAETENRTLRPPDITYVEVRERALSAEEMRVTQALENVSAVTSYSVGVYGDATATVIDSNSTSISVQVQMPYSYEYSCDGAAGAVDGVKTEVLYSMANSSVSVVRITEDIRNACA